jgi:LAO/AO transport system kinase
VASIAANLSLGTFPAEAWRPPIIRTEATTGRGVPELVAAIQRFRAHTAGSQGSRRRMRAEFRLRELLAQRLVQHVERRVLRTGELEEFLERIAARELDPYSAADEIVSRALRGPSV